MQRIRIRLEETNGIASSQAVHPGFLVTNLQNNFGPIQGKIFVSTRWTLTRLGQMRLDMGC